MLVTWSSAESWRVLSNWVVLKANGLFQPATEDITPSLYCEDRRVWRSILQISSSGLKENLKSDEGIRISSVQPKKLSYVQGKMKMPCLGLETARYLDNEVD